MTDMQKKMMLMYFAEVHVSLEKQPSKISYNDLHTNFPFKKCPVKNVHIQKPWIWCCSIMIINITNAIGYPLKLSRDKLLLENNIGTWRYQVFTWKFHPLRVWIGPCSIMQNNQPSYLAVNSGSYCNKHPGKACPISAIVTWTL